MTREKTKENYEKQLAFTQARISTWQMVLLVTLSFFPSRCGTTTNAIWQGPIGIEAQDFARCSVLQETFSNISLQHPGDIWNIGCRFAPSFVHLNECYWSGFQNEYDDTFTFECRANHVITEVEKLYDQNLVDVRLNFKCCKDKDLVMTACFSTELMFTPFTLMIPEEFYVVRWSSDFYNGCMDALEANYAMMHQKRVVDLHLILHPCHHRVRSHQIKLCKLDPNPSEM